MEGNKKVPSFERGECGGSNKCDGDIPDSNNLGLNDNNKDPNLKGDVIASDEKPEVIEEILSEDVKIQNQKDAIELKETGNREFKEANYDKAIDLYTNALDLCPKSYSKTVSVLFANRAACYMKIDMNDMAIDDCSAALANEPYYTKARLRRAQVYERTEKLDEALSDYNEILKYDKTCQAAGEAAMRLPGQINERNEKLKNEMFGKLKELGNTCLKPFGLSTDNFKMTQDPNSGGYSINFQR